MLLVLSCTPVQTPPPAAEVSVPTEPPAGSPALPRTPQSQPVRPPTPVQAPAEASRPFDESLLRGREFLLEAGSRTTAPVRDRYLGPLGGEDSQRRAVEGFLRADPGTSLLRLTEPRWATYLQGWSRRLAAEGFQAATVRTGVPLPDRDGRVMVPVRASGSGIDWTGWVVLSRSPEGEAGGPWLVSDALLTKADPVAGPYDPESGVQLISSPSRR